MPIAFNSVSHGEIPIGFFNIDTDMILINNYFVFASDLCNWLSTWAAGKQNIKTEKGFYVIENPKDIGNLMGAISAEVFTGFIGELYKKFPFPKDIGDFKQKPDGFKNRLVVEKLIQKYANLSNVDIIISKKNETISIGEYGFDRFDFHQILLYLWQGGMPKWRDDEKPGYVLKMMEAVISSKHWLFKFVNVKD